MNKIFGLLTACLFGATALQAAENNHVILISIDGLRPEFYKEASWPTTHIRQALKQGSYADGVTGVFPTVTYPSHTAMITGVKPLKHGIYYNTPPEPLGVTGKWNWYYDSIQVPTLFTAAKAQGLTTASIFWPVSVGVPADHAIPEFWYLPKAKGEKRDMKHALSDMAYPKGFFQELEDNAIGKVDEIDFDGDFLSMDDLTTKMACYTIRKYKPNFLTLHLVTVDHFQHEQGRNGDKVQASLAAVDHAIMQLMEAVEKAGIKENTTFIITGDHGFVDIHTSINPNVWLAQAGLYDPKHPENWKAYFHASGASAFLLMKDKKDTKTLKKVNEILAVLPEDQKKLFMVKDRSSLDQVGASGESFLALAPIKGYTFGNSAEGEVLKKAKGGTHGFYPDFKEIQTGFMAFGYGIRPGVVIPEMSLTDVAPIVAKLLHIPFPSAEGKIPANLLIVE